MRLNKRKKSFIKGFFINLALIIGAVIVLFPIFWMLSASLKKSGTELIFPPQFIPETFEFKNYTEVWSSLPFGAFITNSIIIALLSTIGQIFTGSLAGYAFARINFPGKNIWFWICISTMLLPEVVLLVPQFIIFTKLKWIDTFLPLVVPSWLGGRAFYIFLARQYFLSIPQEIVDASKIDGASNFRIFLNIMLPLAKPVLAAMAVVRFVTDWNDFLAPLLYLTSIEKKTLSVGMYLFLTRYGGNWNLLMAASTIMIVPTLIFFLFTQKYYLKGIVMTGLKE